MLCSVHPNSFECGIVCSCFQPTPHGCACPSMRHPWAAIPQIWNSFRYGVPASRSACLLSVPRVSSGVCSHLLPWQLLLACVSKVPRAALCVRLFPRVSEPAVTGWPRAVNGCLLVTSILQPLPPSLAIYTHCSTHPSTDEALVYTNWVFVGKLIVCSCVNLLTAICPGCWWPLPQGHVDGSWSMWCAERPQVFFLQAAFQSSVLSLYRYMEVLLPSCR